LAHSVKIYVIKWLLIIPPHFNCVATLVTVIFFENLHYTRRSDAVK